MNGISDTLFELRQAPGVKGCALVTPDGLVVAESLDPRVSQDVVSGLASFLLVTTTRCLEEGQMGGLSQFTLHATNGKVVLAEVAPAWLVVILDQFADLDACRGEMQVATQALRRQSRLS